MKIIYKGYFYSNEKNALENAREEYLKHFNISKNFLFFLHSVSKEESEKLNKHYFKKNAPTDVLTIPLYKNIKEISPDRRLTSTCEDQHLRMHEKPEGRPGCRHQ